MITPPSMHSLSDANNFDVGPLTWVIGEVRDALNRSKAALVQAVIDDIDTRSTSLRHAKTYLHQAHGALQMVDVDGIGMITETTEDMLERIESGQVQLDADIAATVSAAYQALIEYLEEVVSGAPNQPVRLFPYYKALLEARGADRIHPADLFFPNLTIRPQFSVLAEDADPGCYPALRQRYERALLPFLKGQSPQADAEHAGAMCAVIAEIEQMQSTQQSRGFWWVLHGFSEAVVLDAVPSEIHVKQLFAMINLQLRRLGDGSAGIAERLLRDALFYIARIESPSPLARQIRAAYRLDDLVPADYETRRYGQIDMNALNRAKQHLAQAKNMWNRIAGGDANPAQAFELEMKAVTEAGCVLNSSSLTKLLRELNGIARQAAYSKPGDVLGMEMATSLLFIENALHHINRLPDNFNERADALTARLLAAMSGETPAEPAQWLDDMAREAQQKQTIAVLAEEMLSNLRQIEKTLEEYFGDPSQNGVLEQIDRGLHQIEGAFAILDQNEALRAIQRTRAAIKGFSDEAPSLPADKVKFEEVAQNIGALSFFIETLQRDLEQAQKGFAFNESDGLFHAYALEKNGSAEMQHMSDASALMPLIETADPITQSKPAQVHALPAATQMPAELREPASRDAIAPTESPEKMQSVEEMDAAQESESAATLQNDAATGDLPSLFDLNAASEELAEHAMGTALVEVPESAEAGSEVLTSDEAIDAELLDIFLTEAAEVLECIQDTLPKAAASSYGQDAMTTLRRSFHTLKGSSRMVGLNSFGEASWAIEQVLNVCLAGEAIEPAKVLSLVEEAAQELEGWAADIRSAGCSHRTPDYLIAAALRVKRGEPVDGRDAGESEPSQQTATEDARNDFVSVDASPLDKPVASVVDLPFFDSQLPAADELVADLASNDDMGAQPALEHAVSDDISGDFMTPDELPVPAQTVDEPTATSSVDVQDESPSRGTDTERLEEPAPRLQTANVLGFPMPAPEGVREEGIRRIGDMEISVPLHNIYLAETDELLRLLAQDIQEWRHEPGRVVTTLAVHAAHSLAGSSATVGFQALHEVAHRLEMVLQQLARQPAVLTPEQFDVLENSVARLAGMMQTFALGEMPPYEPILMDTLDALLAQLAGSVSGAFGGFHFSDADEHSLVENQAFENSLPSGAAPQDSSDIAGQANEERVPAGPEPVRDESSEAASRPVVVPGPVIEATLELGDDLDPDLLPIFIEEGNDLLPQIGEALRRWRQSPSDQSLPQGLLRCMHTIKGSARMAGAMRLGQHVHDMESRVEHIMRGGPPSPQAIDDMLARHDYGLYLFESLQNPQAALPAGRDAQSDADDATSVSTSASDSSSSAVTDAHRATALAVVPGSRQTAADNAATPVAAGAPAPGSASPLVRVRADMLDRLVNQAGEVSISRSKLETEVGTLQNSLGELTENVVRLRGQLRELEIQAETQIASNMTQSGDREFDPLEFDRFTRLQELTRMMAESVNDVASVQQNLARTVDGAAADLAIQARLTRELQQDLMRVRMVQFASVSERLYRVTRQTAKELNKRVNLDIRGSSVEVDRGVLEKMVGPFEHLLRNAIVHGIESHEVRRLAGKNETGEMLIEIRQEGNEVVIRFSDDGQGLDLDRIRQKAVSVGLLAGDRDISDIEARELIFSPGFSTAGDVTELAGRGVGMDVVRSEAAALGGRVAVVSEPGKGAHFTIHLPLTLAVTQVVLLSTGGRVYAVPSVLVEQVQQLKANPLASAYNDGAVLWQGERVPLHYLSSLLGDHVATPTAQQYSPIVIMKAGTDRVAIHADEIIGNREVVVKNIGPQLARMTGIAGATVLGSGEIVLILNPVPLAVRHAQENRRAPHRANTALPAMGAVAEMGEMSVPSLEPVAGLRTQRIVMVVDDSLTVRRVTQRLLAREGYQVVLAKDGVDALEQLQSITPDAMLVDIEMPRMDGFDLTRNVRGDERTRDIPIVMITSRTAVKHRTYAMELGVNEYLGKPYQEDELLKLVAAFVHRNVPVA